MNRPILVTAITYHFLDDVASDESDVGRPLGEASHQIWIPLRAERDIDAHAITFPNQSVLQISADPIEYLKLIATRSAGLLFCESPGLPDDRFVVSGETRIVPLEHQVVHA